MPTSNKHSLLYFEDGCMKGPLAKMGRKRG